MSDFTIHKATRTGVKPLVGMYGKSGSGKTMSALLLARGLVGKDGRITLIDSENGRGSIFADVIPGGYSVLDLDAPFSPMRYEDAIVKAEGASDVVVIDSMSHSWSGEGGVLDWADEELEKMGGGDNNKMRSWIKPKMAHKMMVGRLLRCKVPLICCLRGEEKTHIVKDGAKNKVVTDEFSTPLYDPRFIFEMLLNLETVSKFNPKSEKIEGGFVYPTKITHPDLGKLLPRPDEQIGVKHGEAIARWCSGSASAPTVAPAANGDAELKRAKKALWEVVGPKVNGEVGKMRQFLCDECFINPDEQIEGMNAERLLKVAEQVRTTRI